MVTGSQIISFLSIFLSVQFAFASPTVEYDYELIEREIFDTSYSSLLAQRLADKVVYNGATWLIRLPTNSNRNAHLPKELLDIFSTVDRLFRPDWSLMNVSVYQVIFVYEKLKDFVHAHGRFPVSLQSFLRPYGHVLRGLESKLGMAASQRLGTSLIMDLRATLKAIHSRSVVPDWLLSTSTNCSLENNDLVERAIFAAEAVIRVSLGLDVILAISETHTGEADETLTSQIIAGLYKRNGIYGFLPFSNQRISTQQRRKVYGLLKTYLPVEIFAPGSIHGLAFALMYGSVEDVRKFDLARLFRVINLWSTPSRLPKSWHVFVQHLWAREDFAQLLELLKTQLSLPQHLLTIFACDPKTNCYLNLDSGKQEQLFSEFLCKCATFDETFNRAAFESELFKNFLQSPPPPTPIFCVTAGYARVAAANLAMARARRDDAEAILESGVGYQFYFHHTVNNAVEHPDYVYEGPLVEAYVLAHRPVVYSATWGRIVTSAVVRSDGKLLELLRNKLKLTDDYGLRPFVDFPCTPFYVDIYCSLFDGKEIGSVPAERRRETLADLQKLAKGAAPNDSWTTDVNSIDGVREFVATLRSQMDGLDLETFMQQPSFQP